MALAEALADERKRTQPVGSTDSVGHSHLSRNHLDRVSGLAFAAGRFLPDVLAALSMSNGAFDAVAERQTSALVDAMAAFGAGASAVEPNSAAPHHVLLEHIRQLSRFSAGSPDPSHRPAAAAR